MADIMNADVKYTTHWSSLDIISVQNWDELVNQSVSSIANDFNAKHGTPVDLKEKYDIIGFVSGIIRNLVMTPQKVDNFFYAGFKWITDM